MSLGIGAVRWPAPVFSLIFMSLKDLITEINKLPENLEADLSVGEYLKTLSQSYIEKLNDFYTSKDGMEAFNNFKGVSYKSSHGISAMLKSISERIERFNEVCLKCLKPDSKTVDHDTFVDMFFDKTGKCRDSSVMIQCVDKGMDFYRIRKTSDKNQYELFDYKGMYVIRPDKSSMVGMARFNLSGYACLYLAESLYLAWEECRRPDFHTANFVRFSNRKPLSVFNLTIPDSKNLNSEAALFRAYLSLVCSVKAKDDDKDHWQYRISNLFIRMIYQLDSKDVDGIKYMSSKRFENKNFRIEYVKECAAYVFPPKDVTDQHCKKLASLFEMTEAFSYFYFNIFGAKFISSKDPATREYDNTIFSFLEKQLKKQPAIPCHQVI